MARVSFSDDFRRNFLTGFAALFPILLTLFLLSWLYRQIDLTLGEKANSICRLALASTPGLFAVLFPGSPPQARQTVESRLAYAGQHFPRAVGTWLGLIVVAVAVYLLGAALRGYVGRRVMGRVDRFFERFPVIKAVYPHARQVGDLVFGQSGRRRFSHVVAVEYPRRGMYSLGFQTGQGVPGVETLAGQNLTTVFIPTSPTPLTGFIVMLPPDEVVPLSMTVEEAFRYCLTAGMLVSGRQKPGPALPELPSQDGRAPAAPNENAPGPFEPC